MSIPCAAIPPSKIACGRNPETDADLMSQPTLSRLENLANWRQLTRIGLGLIDQFCRSFAQIPSRIVLDIDDTDDPVQGQQELALFNAHAGGHSFQPIHIFEACSGKPGCAGRDALRLYRWPRSNTTLKEIATPWLLQCDIRRGPRLRKVRRFHQFPCAAGSWSRAHKVIARIEATDLGTDARFVVTNLEGRARTLYEKVYCQRGTAENLIKDMKRATRSDKTACSRWEANQFRLFLHMGAYWLLHGLRRAAPKRSRWRGATLETIRRMFVKIAVRVQEMKRSIKLAFPAAYPHQAMLATITGAITIGGP
jgi:Transposase DDE domain group 1